MLYRVGGEEVTVHLISPLNTQIISSKKQREKEKKQRKEEKIREKKEKKKKQTKEEKIDRGD